MNRIDSDSNAHKVDNVDRVHVEIAGAANAACENGGISRIHPSTLTSERGTRTEFPGATLGSWGVVRCKGSSDTGPGRESGVVAQREETPEVNAAEGNRASSQDGGLVQPDDSPTKEQDARMELLARGAEWCGENDFGGEFDPGSGSTLAACLMHASRTEPSSEGHVADG